MPYKNDMDKKVAELLAATEQSLAKFSGEYAASRNYDRASLLLSMASEVGALASKWSKAIGASPTVEDVGLHLAPERSQLLKRRGGKKSEYPKFYRNGDWLVKIGYSKAEGEYEHKSPKSALFLLADAVLKVGAKGARFSMADLLPLNTAEGTEIPSYQPYLCLNWLREVGLVQQHGRRGYSISKASNWLDLVQTGWDRLPPAVQS
jgi:hypothetical protein